MCSTGSRAPLQGAPGAPEDGSRPQPRSGTYSGWLSKAKGDGARAKWLGAAGRRYFTIDWDNHVVFYSHSESSKQVSVPTPFADILGADMSVESAAGGGTPAAWTTAPTMRRTISSSLLGGAPPTGPRPATCFALHTVDRRVRLEARTEFEARSWVQELNNAKMLGLERQDARQGRQDAAKDQRRYPSESSGASQSTSASGSSCGAAPSGRTTPSSEAGGPDSAGRCMAGTVGAGSMDAVQELQRALQEEMDTKAASDLAQRRQRERVPQEEVGAKAAGDLAQRRQGGLEAADFGLDEDGGLPGDEPGSDEESPSSPLEVPSAGAEAPDDGSGEECGQEARRLRAQGDMRLAGPARAGVAGRRRSRKGEQSSRCAGAEQAGEGGAAADPDSGDAEASRRVAADMRLVGRGGSTGARGRSGAGVAERTTSAASRAERIAADLSNGDADAAARIAADLMLVERLKGMGGGGR